MDLGVDFGDPGVRLCRSLCLRLHRTLGMRWHRLGMYLAAPGMDLDAVRGYLGALGVHWHRRVLGTNLYRLKVDSDAVGVDLRALGMNWYRR